MPTVHVIIDGYNVMRASTKGVSREAPFQAQREAFINQVAEYRRGTTHDVTLVFDGTKGAEKYSRATNVFGVRVIYSAQGETADEVIVSLVRQSSRPVNLMVVTSDREVQRAAKAQGATVAPAQEMVEKLANPSKVEETMTDRASYMERVMKGVQEGEAPLKKKKKGMANRPKKDRRRHRL